MQTNVGSFDSGQFFIDGEQTDDPFFGDSRKTVPDNWKIQYLNNNSEWTDLQDGTSSLQLDETSVGADGYLELAYGLIVPEEYKDIFVYAGKKFTVDELPDSAPLGYTYLVRESFEKGKFYIWNNSEDVVAEGVPLGYSEFDPTYGWQKELDQPDRFTNYVTEFVDPEFYLEDDENVYTEIQYLLAGRGMTRSH
jgi:hypothetical protein